MIIFGWGFNTRKKFGVYMTRECNLCNRITEWNLCRRTTWFTLFFIPIIPYKTEKCLECKRCKGYISLSDEEFENCKQEIEILHPKAEEEHKICDAGVNSFLYASIKVVTIGRGQDNDIVINDPLVSRNHCQITKDDNGNMRLTDLNSVNGVYVNGIRISGEVSLNKTDIVRIGNTTLPIQSYFSEPLIMPQNEFSTSIN